MSVLEPALPHVLLLPVFLTEEPFCIGSSIVIEHTVISAMDLYRREEGGKEAWV